MTIPEIENYMNNLRYKSYSTGAIHVSQPEWARDLLKCMRIIRELIDIIEKYEEITK
jgi:hypothetical protein